jgi:uncharacterized protein YjdB
MSIGDYAFYYCSNLAEAIFLNQSPPDIGKNIFKNCSQLVAIYVPHGNVDTYKEATSFSDYVNLIQGKINSVVTVNEGSGSGNYDRYATVTIVANTDTKEKMFQFWSSTSEVSFANAFNQTTTFVMPVNNVVITANYAYLVTANNASVTESHYKDGDSVTITANSAPEGQEFTGWTTEDEIIFADAGSVQTTFTMPAKPVTVTANYKVSNVDVTGITLSQTNVNLKVGNTITLSATITPSNASNTGVTWSSSNESIATVDQNGLVTSKGIGSAIITAISSSNTALSTTCTMNVSIGKVSSLIAKKNKTTSITLTWEKQNNVSGYNIYRYDSSKKKYIKIETVKKASTITYTDKKRKVATTYKYKVRAYVTINKKIKYGSYSDILKTATNSKKPTISVKTGSKKATLTWNKVSSISGYEIYISKKKSSGYTKIKTVTSYKTTKYIKKSLVKGKTYYFKIRTYKTVAGVKIYSSYSMVKKVKVK